MEVLLLVVFVGSLGFAVYQIAGLINPVGTSITLEEAEVYNALHNPKILGMQGLSEQIAKDMFDPPAPIEDQPTKEYVDAVTEHEVDLSKLEVPDFAKIEEEARLKRFRNLTRRILRKSKKKVKKPVRKTKRKK